MKVVAVIDSLDRGGTEQSVADLLPAVGAFGVHSTVVQLADRGGFASELDSVGIPVHTLASTSRRERIRELRRLLSSLEPDLVHTQLFEADIAGRIAAASLLIPVISSLVNESYGPEHLHAPGLRPIRVRSAQAADAATARLVCRFHAVSDPVRATMSRRLFVSKRRIEVIPRGRDAGRLGRAGVDRRRAVRRALDVDPDEPLILAVGRHEWQKGFDVLLEAVPLLRQPHGTVVLAGRPGNQTPALEQRGRSLDGSGWRWRMLGARDDVGDLLAAADVLAFPSRWEGLPGTLIEALALETPIVASDIAPVREVAGQLPGARFVAPDDVAALAGAISTVLADTPDVTGHRQRFEQQYELRSVARRMSEFYRRAL